MFPLHMLPCPLAPLKCHLALVTGELFVHSMDFLMLPQVPQGAGSVIALCASIRPLLLQIFSAVVLFPASLWRTPLGWTFVSARYYPRGGSVSDVG